MPFNQIILIGNCTRDPQVKFLPSTSICEFGLAVTEKYKTKSGEDRENTLFIDCKIWGKPAEWFSEQVKKGSHLTVIGKLVYETWDDKQSGAKRSKHTINVLNWMVGAPRENRQAAPQASAAPRQLGVKPQNPPPSNPIGDDEHFTESEIPF